MDISKNIAELRKAKGLTQEQLAQAVNVSSQAVSKWETGASLPDVQTLPLIADVFGVSVDYLYKVKELVYDDIHEKIFRKLCEHPQMSEQSYKDAMKVFGAAHHGIFRGRWAKDSFDSPCPNHISNQEGLSLLWSKGVGALVTKDFFREINEATVKFAVPLLEALADKDRLKILLAIISMCEISIYELAERLGLEETVLEEKLELLIERKIVFEEISKHKALGKTYKINDMYHTGLCLMMAILETTRDGEVHGISCCMGYGDYPVNI